MIEWRFTSLLGPEIEEQCPHELIRYRRSGRHRGGLFASARPDISVGTARQRRTAFDHTDFRDRPSPSQTSRSGVRQPAADFGRPPDSCLVGELCGSIRCARIGRSHRRASCAVSGRSCSPQLQHGSDLLVVALRESRSGYRLLYGTDSRWGQWMRVAPIRLRSSAGEVGHALSR